MVLYITATGAALSGWGVKLLINNIHPFHPLVSGALILGVYVIVYFLAGSILGISESKKIVNRVFSKFR
jgi:hypothetical protein